MHLSIDIQNDYYQQFLKLIETLPIQIIESEDEPTYLGSEQYQKDRATLHNSLADIESGRVELVPHDHMWEELYAYTQAQP